MYSCNVLSYQTSMHGNWFLQLIETGFEIRGLNFYVLWLSFLYIFFGVLCLLNSDCWIYALEAI